MLLQFMRVQIDFRYPCIFSIHYLSLHLSRLAHNLAYWHILHSPKSNPIQGVLGPPTLHISIIDRLNNMNDNSSAARQEAVDAAKNMKEGDHTAARVEAGDAAQNAGHALKDTAVYAKDSTMDAMSKVGDKIKEVTGQN